MSDINSDVILGKYSKLSRYHVQYILFEEQK